MLNGFHETWAIVYRENAYGLARTGQTIVAALDGSMLRLDVDDEPLHLATSPVLRFRPALDMQIGVLVREYATGARGPPRVHRSPRAPRARAAPARARRAARVGDNGAAFTPPRLFLRSPRVRAARRPRQASR
jgi:hypothetical protein